MNTRTMIFSSPNLLEFKTALESIGKTVGPRKLNGKVRRDRTLERELWCLRRYIGTLLNNGHWDFPCSIHRGVAGIEADFVAEFNDECIGIEITEATTPHFQQELSSSEGNEGLYMDSMDGWVGDLPERMWHENIVSAIFKKAGKIGAYKNAKRTDLLVYSNHPADLFRSTSDSVEHIEYLRAVTGHKYPGIDHVVTTLLDAKYWLSALSSDNLGKISVIDGTILNFDILGDRGSYSIAGIDRSCST